MYHLASFFFVPLGKSFGLGQARMSLGPENICQGIFFRFHASLLSYTPNLAHIRRSACHGFHSNSLYMLISLHSKQKYMSFHFIGLIFVPYLYLLQLAFKCFESLHDYAFFITLTVFRELTSASLCKTTRSASNSEVFLCGE